MANLFSRLVKMGWKVVTVTGPMGKKRRQVRCPKPGCTMQFTVNDTKQPIESGHKIESLGDLGHAIEERRNSLGISQSQLEPVVGLTTGHLSKIIVGADRSLLPEGATDPVILTHIIQNIRDVDIPEDVARALFVYLERSQAKLGDRSAPRVPKMDTLIWIVTALGGDLNIVWGEPPAVTRQIVDQKIPRKQTRMDI